ncbi:MAG: sugar phosphate isomerase/epimerase [Gemmataceae bacterium]|nr:sugar phosphate isomerase/epimerase [Gemmataceae bacterium]
MTTPTRRAFLQTALVTGAALAAGQGQAHAIDPIRRQGQARLRLSLAAYSYNRFLSLRGKQKPTMTLEEFIDAAATTPTEAVELTAYYFRETTPRYLADLKGRCTRLGLDISGTAVGNNFCVTNAARLKEQIADVKRWVEHTSRLGGKTIRIFAGNVEKGDAEEKARARCIAAIQEACDHAGQFGIYLALENHGGITANVEQMLAIVKGVKHDWFGVNLDSGNFHTKDPYADLARIAPYAVVAQLKTAIRRAGAQAEPADLKRLVGMLRAVNYRGYVALEYEAAEDPKVAVPRHLTALRRLMD